jgi:hypothetical protein
MLNSLPDDLLWHVSSFLNVSDSLKIDKSFNIYYTPYAIKIQKWYRKCKEKRDLRYSILKNEFQIRNKKMYTAFYANIFFNLYNMKKLIKFLKEYYFLSLLKYFCRDIQNEDILHIYDNTLENMTYSNCKKFLKILPMKLLLRI